MVEMSTEGKGKLQEVLCKISTVYEAQRRQQALLAQLVGSLVAMEDGEQGR